MKYFVLVVLAFFLGLFASLFIRQANNQGLLGQIPLDTAIVNASTTVATSATAIFSDATNAQFRTITNLGPNPIYITKKSTSTGFVAGVGQVIFASTTYEMTEANGNLWTGNIYGITGAGSSSITTSQL